MDARELRWLAQQQWPVWGGRIDRGEPPIPELATAEACGLIARVSEPWNGYVITEKGRAVATPTAQE